MVKSISLWGAADAWKFSFMPLTSLDHEALPLILARSKREISLLNLELETMEIIINTDIGDTTTP